MDVRYLLRVMIGGLIDMKYLPDITPLSILHPIGPDLEFTTLSAKRSLCFALIDLEDSTPSLSFTQECRYVVEISKRLRPFQCYLQDAAFLSRPFTTTTLSLS
jgi:hypothetical protein